MMKLILTFLVAQTVSPPALSANPDVIGLASVTDGDTIIIREQRIRVEGIDAPESRQLCKTDGKPWRCGQKASLALSDKIGRKTVRCEHLGTSCSLAL